MSLLEIKNLTVTFELADQPFTAVDQVDLTVEEGEVIGIVGESGSGKSVTMLALMGLIGASGRVQADVIKYDHQDLLKLSVKQRRKIIGKDIAMIFQDPMTSLNPSYTVGYQIVETLKTHVPARASVMREQAIELLNRVEIPDPEARFSAYPHQLSGGMSQRVMIAMALACQPKLLIADEPTTALDVTIQAQILALLVNLQRKHHMSLILITHDLAVVSETAQRVAVMYAGQVVEIASVPAIFKRPHHPYTEALLSAIPELSAPAERLPTLVGVVPGQYDRPQGCLLSPRCCYRQEVCSVKRPMLESIEPQAQARCYFPLHLDNSSLPTLSSAERQGLTR